MAGVFKKKPSMFGNEAAMPPVTKSFNVREADGGFIVDTHESSGSKVAKTLAAVIKILKETFSDSEAPGEDDGDD